MSRANRNKIAFTVINSDVDNLKTINDKHGHKYGDLILKEFGTILKNSSRKTDIAARTGGDEFIILLSETDEIQAQNVARRILEEANSRNIDVKGESINISVSLGIASYPSHGSTIEEVLNRADIAMYKAKQAGKNQIQMSQVPKA
jgi:diguanylate cyclase (GGDEF)-like protein